MRIILLGPPGAGKGTVAGLLKEKVGLAHISMGDILREEMKSKSALGAKIRGYVERGDLVPDEVVTEIIRNKLAQKKTGNRFMLDGFPRTTAQAKDLDRILADLKQPLDYAFYLEATLPVITQRLSGRRVCRECGALYHMQNKPPKKPGVCDVCGGEVYQRADDNPGTIHTRMEVYLKSTSPIIEYYQKQGKLQKVDADRDAQELMQAVMGILNEDKRANQNKVSPRA